MKVACRRIAFFALILLAARPVPAPAQSSPAANSSLAFHAPSKKAPGLVNPQGFRDRVAGGKLRLTLDDAIRLALENNTNIRLDQSQIETAKDAIQRAYSPFDFLLGSNFSDSRSVSPQYTQLTASNSLTQTTLVTAGQTLETGTNYQVSFNASKFSSNSAFNIFNPAISTGLAFSVTQPLLRGAGLFVNRAPIIIARRGLAQTRASFEAQVNDIILQVVNQYWSVVEARENLAVQRESLDEAQKTYDHDKHSLELGALAPPDIYRSESQVASRKFSVIQAEYALKQTEDQFREVIGADIDPAIRALELDLAEKAEPTGALMSADLPTAIQKALAYRPEAESVRLQLANDDTNIRVARNSLKPNLSLTGTYQTNGLNEIISNSLPSRGTFGDAINQTFGFGFPSYGFTISLSLPVKNHAAEANLGDARVSKVRDLYSERQLHETITFDVTNSVHQLEQAKVSMDAAKSALDLAQETLKADQRKYDLGAETVFFVLDAQTQLTQAEQNLLQAQVGYQLAVVAVEHATGGLLDQFHVQISSLAK